MTTKKIALGDLDWDDLRVFLAIARVGSLTEAARALKLDHSTVSRRLSQLEMCLGGALFERHRSGLKPTELAATILPHVETAERGVIGLRETLTGGADEPSGTVRIAMMEGIGSLYLARLLLPLMKRYPLLKLELVTSARQVNVSRREADLFLSFFEVTGPRMRCERAGSFTLSLYGSDAYFRELGEPASVDDLKNHRFTGYLEDMIQVSTVRWLEEVIAEPQMFFRSNSMIAQMTAAASGAGLVLLPRFAVEKEPALRPVLEREVVVHRDIFLSVHEDLQYATRIKAVVSYLKELLEADRSYLNGPWAS
jgi:DNA-binding transcriptional LysR family regulator